MSIRKYIIIGRTSLAFFVILLIVFLSLIINRQSKKETKDNWSDTVNIKTNDHESSNKRSYTFVLTHLLGKKLTKDAYFTVGDIKVWELNFKNGKIIKYTIIYMNPNNPMCGITARDNFGDTCEICISKTSGDGTSIEIKYGSRVATYKGYLLR